MKKILTVILILLLCLPVTGCGERRTLTVLCDDYLIDSPCVTEAVKYFEDRRNTDVILKEYSRELLFEGGADMYIHPLDSDFVKLGMRNNFYEFSNEAWVNDISQYCYESVMYGGDVYGFPYGTAYITGCFYNKKIFEEHGLSVPKNQKEFEALCDTLVDLDIIPLYVAGADVWPIAYQSAIDSVLSKRPRYITELNSGEVTMADIPGISLMLDWWKKGSDNGWFGKNWHDAKFSDAAGMLSEGKAAMIICSDNWINTSMTSGGKYRSSDFEIMPIFMGVNENGYLSGSQVCMISVNLNSPMAGVGLDFVSMISDPEVYNLFYSGVSTIPVLENQEGIVTTDQFDAVNQDDIVSMSAFYPRIEGFNQQAGAQAILDYTKGKISLEQCMEELGGNGE